MIKIKNYDDYKIGDYLGGENARIEHIYFSNKNHIIYYYNNEVRYESNSDVKNEVILNKISTINTICDVNISYNKFKNQNIANSLECLLSGDEEKSKEIINELYKELKYKKKCANRSVYLLYTLLIQLIIFLTMFLFNLNNEKEFLNLFIPYSKLAMATSLGAMLPFLLICINKKYLDNKIYYLLEIIWILFLAFEIGIIIFLLANKVIIHILKEPLNIKEKIGVNYILYLLYILGGVIGGCIGIVSIRNFYKK